MLDYKLLRDAWLEVDLDSLLDNIKNIKSYLGDNVAITAVIKANAYGMGSVVIGETLIKGGVDYLAVANLPEALELRSKSSNWPIMVMGHTSEAFVKEAIKANITLTVGTLDIAKAISRVSKSLGLRAKVHIKIDTGFNRLGFKLDLFSLEQMLKVLELDYIDVEGVFSHLALEDRDKDYKQYNEFVRVRELIESKIKGSVKYYHICDSISAVEYPEFHMNMCRIGALMYGMKSYRYPDFPVKPIMSFKARIAHLKTIEPGEGVSYDGVFVAKRPTKVATLPFGYADGYPRNLMGKGEVIISGKRCPVIGILCMDQCMVDVTDLEEVKIGQEVIVYGKAKDEEITIEEIAQKALTNKNEILCRIAARVPRVYIRKGGFNE